MMWNRISNFIISTSEVYTSQYDSSTSRSLHITLATTSANTVIVMSKLIMGILSFHFLPVPMPSIPWE